MLFHAERHSLGLDCIAVLVGNNAVNLAATVAGSHLCGIGCAGNGRLAKGSLTGVFKVPLISQPITGCLHSDLRGFSRCNLYRFRLGSNGSHFLFYPVKRSVIILHLIRSPGCVAFRIVSICTHRRKGHAVNLRCVSSENYNSQFIAGFERPLFNTAQAIRETNISQAITVTKRIISNAGHAVRKINIAQAITVIERRASNPVQALRESYTAQDIAVKERTASNAG